MITGLLPKSVSTGPGAKCTTKGDARRLAALPLMAPMQGPATIAVPVLSYVRRPLLAHAPKNLGGGSWGQWLHSLPVLQPPKLADRREGTLAEL